MQIQVKKGIDICYFEPDGAMSGKMSTSVLSVSPTQLGGSLDVFACSFLGGWA